MVINGIARYCLYTKSLNPCTYYKDLVNPFLPEVTKKKWPGNLVISFEEKSVDHNTANSIQSNIICKILFNRDPLIFIIDPESNF